MATTEIAPAGAPLKGLCVLLADEDRAALTELRDRVESLGHEVLARAVGIADIAQALAEDEPDIALVEVRNDPEHAIDLMRELVDEAGCPIVLVLEEADADFAARTAELGVFACVRSGDVESIRDAIEIAVRRHRDVSALGEQVDGLSGALDRRAVIERAKGILMERHEIPEDEAFEMLRTEARSSNRRVAELSRSVVDGRALLPKQP